jgi:hypothetical protein
MEHDPTFEFIGRYFWLICIGVTLIKDRISRAQVVGVPIDPETQHAISIARARVRWGMLAPWLVMGAGIMFGHVPGVWSYFKPQEMNPYVWAWYATIFAMAVAFAWWVFLGDGALRAVQLGIVNMVFFGRRVNITERWVKIYAAIGPPFVVLWVYLAWSTNVPSLK